MLDCSYLIIHTEKSRRYCSCDRTCRYLTYQASGPGYTANLVDVPSGSIFKMEAIVAAPPLSGV